MEEKKTTTEQWVEGIENIAETYRSLITVRVVEQTSLGATLSFLGIIFLMFTICILIFLGLGTAWWVGKELNNPAAGFFLVGGLFLFLVLILIVATPKYLLPAIRNLIIRNMYAEDK